MNKAEYAQFRKCMALTISANDAEALAALRRANLMLAKHSLTWDNVFDRVVRVIDPVEVIIEDHPSASTITGAGGRRKIVPDHDDEDWDSLFEDARRGVRGDFLTVLESIHQQWERSGSMSPRQKQVVREAAERYAERHPGGRVR